MEADAQFHPSFRILTLSKCILTTVKKVVDGKKQLCCHRLGVMDLLIEIEIPDEIIIFSIQAFVKVPPDIVAEQLCVEGTHDQGRLVHKDRKTSGLVDPLRAKMMGVFLELPGGRLGIVQALLIPRSGDRVVLDPRAHPKPLNR